MTEGSLLKGLWSSWLESRVGMPLPCKVHLLPEFYKNPEIHSFPDPLVIVLHLQYFKNLQIKWQFIEFPSLKKKKNHLRWDKAVQGLTLIVASIPWRVGTAARCEMLLTFKELITALDVLNSRGAGGNAVAMNGFVTHVCLTGSWS